MNVSIDVITKDINQFKITGSNDAVDTAVKDVFIGAIPNTINCMPETSNDDDFDLGNYSLSGSSANYALMQSIINTVCLSPLQMNELFPKVSLSYQGVDGMQGQFSCNMYSVNSDFRGSKNCGAALDDIRNYIFYNNLKSSEHKNLGLGGCVTEDFFLYREEVLPSSGNRGRTTQQYTQHGQKTIKQVYPTETNKSAVDTRSLFFGKTVNTALKKMGLGQIKMGKALDSDGSTHQDMVIDVGYEYAIAHGLYNVNADTIKDNGKIEVPVSKMTALFFEIVHMCADMVTYKTHIPIVLLNYNDYADIPTEEVIPMLRAFNQFIKSTKQGIVLYFNVDTTVPKFYDSMMTVNRIV